MALGGPEHLLGWHPACPSCTQRDPRVAPNVSLWWHPGGHHLLPQCHSLKVAPRLSPGGHLGGPQGATKPVPRVPPSHGTQQDPPW